MYSYQDSFEVDDCFICPFVMIKNGVCKLRHIMPSIALSSNKKISVFILRKSLQPIHQEQIIICSCFLISIGTIICWFVWIGKPYSSRWLQEQNIGNFKTQLQVRSTIILFYSIGKKKTILILVYTSVPWKCICVQCFAITVYSKGSKFLHCSIGKRRTSWAWKVISQRIKSQ